MGRTSACALTAVSARTNNLKEGVCLWERNSDWSVGKSAVITNEIA